MKTTNESSATRIVNFANASSLSVGSNLRDNVLSAAGAKRHLSVVIARDTVTLYGPANNAYSALAVKQVTEAGGLNCTAYLV